MGEIHLFFLFPFGGSMDQLHHFTASGHDQQFQADGGEEFAHSGLYVQTFPCFLVALGINESSGLAMLCTIPWRSTTSAISNYMISFGFLSAFQLRDQIVHRGSVFLL